MALVDELSAVLPPTDSETGERIFVVYPQYAMGVLQTLSRLDRGNFIARTEHSDGTVEVKTFSSDPEFFMRKLAPGDSAVFVRNHLDGTPKLAYVLERVSDTGVVGHYMIGEHTGSPVLRRALWDIGIRQTEFMVTKGNSLLNRLQPPGTVRTGETKDGRSLQFITRMMERP